MLTLYFIYLLLCCLDIKPFAAWGGVCQSASTKNEKLPVKPGIVQQQHRPKRLFLLLGMSPSLQMKIHFKVSLHLIHMRSIDV